jgi:hypothetical protein
MIEPRLLMIYIFARDLVEAVQWTRGRFSREDWTFVGSTETLRMVFGANYIILPGFEQHPQCETLKATIKLRQMVRVPIGDKD